MRPNVKRGLGVSQRSRQAPLPSIESREETVSPRERPPTESRSVGSWAEDWNDPSTHPRMSAIWPVLWIAVPLVLLVLYGLLSGH